ncbi:MAG: 2-oxoglutarate dehydrogenase E1 component [Bacteroidia bacterium]|nr:2-oxoglutarate dehydrogenase E1 component [Bacteroidia bacterium]
MSDYSYVFNAHPSFIDEMYAKYQKDPASVEEGWRTFFQGFEFASSDNGNGIISKTSETGSTQIADVKEFSVMSMIHGYRDRGHLLSTTNPIKKRRDRKPFLAIEDYGLESSDLSRKFYAANEIGMSDASLAEIIERLQKIYCGNIGFEYAHIENKEKRMWLRNKIESRSLDKYDLSLEQKKRILEKLNGAVGFEKFLHTKYVGQKRFSLEGGETTIPAIDAIINKASEMGAQEVVMGMAHRGRLNILANILGKTYEQIFSEFEGTAVPDLSFGDGDVKYHLGFSSQVETSAGKIIDLKLVPNPSHLESVDPVVEGFSRAKADILYNSDYDKILPILIHGDAAIAGQGVAYETVQMSQLEGYYTGGTIHFVINNQIGFTTDFDDARSSTYCTAAAHLVQAPVFHVNGDDPEAVVFAAELATEYREKFNNDVFIDMVCYRKHGHNEGDDPKFTQPEMYSIINKHKNPREIYGEVLVKRGDLEKKLAENLEKEYWQYLQERLDEVKEKPLPYTYQEPEQEWRKLKKKTTWADFNVSPKTGIARKSIEKINEHLLRIPDGLTPLSKVNRLLKRTQKLWDEGKLDWGMAELMAYGSLLMEGENIRMSGQDVKRGTFSHRHAIFNDIVTGKEYNRLYNIESDQGRFMIYNSLLSEFGVLGFEYGYSLATPHSLVVWEAQFGDFYNGAQTIVDQYISAAESKWRRMSGLVMLLPHGYEGQGPEHSSGRIERFLQMCSERNMTIVNITTPANFFHALRRQLSRPFRKPLVVMSPKSLLRHPECISDIKDFIRGTKFEELYDDPTADPKKVKRLLLCTGKIYYDLLAHKKKHNREDVAIIRLEQLYPLPKKQLEALPDKYKDFELYWVQEEPSNMGAWQYIISYYRKLEWTLVARKSSASPATGYKKVHEEQQKDIVTRAFK